MPCVTLRWKSGSHVIDSSPHREVAPFPNLKNTKVSKKYPFHIILVKQTDKNTSELNGLKQPTLLFLLIFVRHLGGSLGLGGLC